MASENHFGGRATQFFALASPSNGVDLVGCAFRVAVLFTEFCLQEGAITRPYLGCLLPLSSSFLFRALPPATTTTSTTTFTFTFLLEAFGSEKGERDAPSFLPNLHFIPKVLVGR